MSIPSPVFVIVMGVSGSGKSTLGAALAKEIGLSYMDGDDLHPPENVAKMSEGIPLNDDDRWPWLYRIRQEGVHACKQYEEPIHGEESKQRGVVIGCSALKKSYRKVLRGEELPPGMNADSAVNDPPMFPTRFVFIHGERDELFKRMFTRKGHYMKPQMLESQLVTLEAPDPNEEDGIIIVDLLDSTETQLQKALEGLRIGGSS
ncbi:hypothetical protein FRC18_004311 [Serendipita sp. 400]|nr:hypothetical protein FRC18_004311 [Serendipita sp. 400]